MDIPSTAAQIMITIIPIVGIIFGFAIMFSYLFWNNKQKILMIEKGLLKKTDFDLDSFSLLAGLVLLAVGGSLVLFFLFKQGWTYGVLSGLIPFSIGLSLIIFFIIRSKKTTNDQLKR